MARRTWRGLVDQGPTAAERTACGALTNSRAEESLRPLFDYRFERYGLKALP